MSYPNFSFNTETKTDSIPELEPEEIHVQFDVDGLSSFPIQPIIVHDVDTEIVSITEEHTDQCGHTETDRVGDKGVDMEFNGLLTKSQMETLKQGRLQSDTLYVTSDDHTGSLFFDTFNYTSHSDQNYIEYREQGRGELKKEKVYTFNLKLTAEKSDENN